MIYAETIIVGGGPSGSTCAWELKQADRDVLVLNREPFPHTKLCAGWITQKVIDDLRLVEEDYPHEILPLKIRTHLPWLPFPLPGIPTIDKNYSIRRVEFDQWLLERSGADFRTHEVQKIEFRDDEYHIDDKFSCKYLVGAGGTACPVRRTLFPNERVKSRQLATLEIEFDYPSRSDTCHLYFLKKGLIGYAWYVPKADGFLNIGLGGKSSYFKKSQTNIHDHFKAYLQDLEAQDLIDAETIDGLKVSGHPYFLYSFKGQVKHNNCFIIGDAAGLATVDMAEGIGPAVESATQVADEILGHEEYQKQRLSKYSFGGPAQWVMKKTLGKYHAENH